MIACDVSITSFRWPFVLFAAADDDAVDEDRRSFFIPMSAWFASPNKDCSSSHSYLPCFPRDKTTCLSTQDVKEGRKQLASRHVIDLGGLPYMTFGLREETLTRVVAV